MTVPIPQINSGNFNLASAMSGFAIGAAATVLAFVAINPTGTPALATGGVGDILTGLVAGFLAQFPGRPEQAVIAAVYLHGLAGELSAAAKSEPSLIATDLLDYLPAAIHACTNVPDPV